MSQAVIGVLGKFIPPAVAAARRYGLRSLDVIPLASVDRSFAADMVAFGVPSIPGVDGKHYCDLMDGLLVMPGSGPGERDPSALGHQESDVAVVTEAVARELPILAVSGGAALLLMSLNQDAEGKESRDTNVVVGQSPRVQLNVTNSELRQFFGAGFQIDSPDPGNLMSLGPNFRPSAVDSAGTVHMSAAVNGSILVVGWHPERAALGTAAADGPFKWLHEHASNFSKRRRVAV